MEDVARVLLELRIEDGLGIPEGLTETFDDLERIGPALLALIAMGALHEAIHGAVMALCGHRPVFGVKYLVLALYAAAPGQRFTRGQWLTVALAPLVVISVVGCA